MLTDDEVEAVIDALVIIINLDTEFGGFASVARTTFPDDSVGPDLKRRYAAVMRPKISEFQQKLAKGSLEMRQALGGARVH